jgi:hypothetical protein
VTGYDVSTLAPRQNYKLLCGGVVPRPLARVSCRSLVLPRSNTRMPGQTFCTTMNVVPRAATLADPNAGIRSSVVWLGDER